MAIVNSLFPQIFSLLSLWFIISLSLVVLKNSHKLVNKLFFILTLILDYWVIGSFMMFNSTQEHQIITWDRFVYAAVVFWPALQYHFSLAVTYINRRRHRLLVLAYILSPTFLILSQTNYFVKDVFYYTWGAHTRAQFLHHFFLAFFAVYGLLFFYNLIKKYKHDSSHLERKRTLYYILGFSVLDFIGGTAFLPAYLIPFYPIFLATPLIFSLIIAYAITYFGLMDIKLIMRRYFVYFLSLVSVLAPIYICLYYVDRYFPHFLFFASLVVFIFALSVFFQIKNYFYRFSNKYFFSSLYDFNELIYSLNNRLRASLDISQIFQSTISLLSQAFHSKMIAVVSYEARSKYWPVLYNQNFDFSTNRINFDYKLLGDLFINNRPIALSNWEKVNDPKYKGLVSYLNSWQIEVVVPIKINQKKLSSLMLFGPKESGEAYNIKDLRVLESVAAEIAISLENALLYQSVTKFNLKLKSEVDKATKQLQEQNETLKKLDQAKTEFIGIASHQLRTPLTGIRWFTELLLKNKEQNLNPKQLDFLEQVSASNQRMIKLVNDLLDVSHIETGRKFDIIKNEFSLNDVIQEVLKENVFLISTKGLIIDNQVDPGLKIFADRDKIKQVWQNLISNATKYSGDKTTIKILWNKDKDNNHVFSVKDQGIGIPKDQQNQIFNKFFRASNASLQHSDGTGLGLYIAREIARAHGGEMWFESVEQEGTTFFFSLPSLPDTINKKIKK
ncbi:MAG: ATP-binding protein [Patescibacteria group bacterium]